jgi:hypothetical protein
MTRYTLRVLNTNDTREVINLFKLDGNGKITHVAKNVEWEDVSNSVAFKAYSLNEYDEVGSVLIDVSRLDNPKYITLNNSKIPYLVSMHNTDGDVV